jgi:hypothetical protein
MAQAQARKAAKQVIPNSQELEENL